MKKDYEFRLYGAATSGVETTVASSNLRNAPTVKGQQVDVLKGRTQSQPWEVEINDNGDFFSALIADSSGRMTLQGRLCDLRLDKDGAGFSVIGTGRVGDVIDHVSHYTVSVQDERWRERTATVFTKQNVASGSGSTSLYSGTILQPAGLITSYGSQFNARQPVGAVGKVLSTDGNLAYVGVTLSPREGNSDWNESIVQLVFDDVKTDARVDTSASTGNFTDLRANVDGTDYPVASFDAVAGSGALGKIVAVPETVVNSLGEFTSGYWVVDDGAVLTAGDEVKAYLYMPNAEPNELMPLHIGATVGIHPFQLLKDLYDEASIAYSTSAMQTLIDDTDFGTSWWRITEPQILSEWVEDHLYAPYGVIPLLNSTGAVVPTKTHLPQAINSTDLFEFTSANLAAEPEWHNSARDRVTVIRYNYTVHDPIHIHPFEDEWPADLIRVSNRTIERTHDRLDSGEAPRREVEYTLDGTHHDANGIIIGTAPTVGVSLWHIDRFADSMAREKFQRFGDGPIRGTCIALSTAESVTTGDFARITLGTFPSPANQSRGATRIVQIMSRVDTPMGPEFEWLDAGPSLNALTAPSVILAPTTSDARHSAIATISGSSSGAGYQLQWGTGSTEPGSTSWNDWAGQGDSTGTNTIRPLPSGTQFWTRARATAPNRIRSAWSTAADTTTGALEAPTGLASSSITGTGVNLDWSLGTSDSPNYPIEMRLSTGACPTTELSSLTRLPAKTVQFAIRGMTQDTTHCVGIRHYDAYGGVSAENTLSIQATTSPPAAPSLIGFELIAGSTS